MAEVAVAVYTATTAAAVVGIHSVMADAVDATDALAGGTDYVVARGTSILEAGNYVGKAGRWRKR